MLLFVIQQVLLSLILIAIVHYIYEFFKNNLTEPKIKDLVNKPKAKYEQIYKTVGTEQEKTTPTVSMKAELQDYLNELSKNDNSDSPTGMLPAQDNFFDNNYQSL